MNEKTLLKKIVELLKVYNGKSPAKCREFVKLVQAHQAPQNSNELHLSASSVTILEETLDYLRTCIKYQVFDLEATGRENTYLRKLLQEDS